MIVANCITLKRLVGCVHDIQEAQHSLSHGEGSPMAEERISEGDMSNILASFIRNTEEEYAKSPSKEAKFGQQVRT